MASMTVPVTDRVVGGVDTHKDVHVAAVLNQAGAVLGTASFATSPTGYAGLTQWLQAAGVVQRVGVEGTGSYGAGLARHLARAGLEVVEVNRPNRVDRRRRGKSDTLDAVAAARAAALPELTAVPKARDGQVEALRMLRATRHSAVKARSNTVQLVKNLLVTAPEALREQLRDLPLAALVKLCARTRPDLARYADPTVAAKISLRSLARRYQQLSAEIADLDALLVPLVEAIAPQLTARIGISTETAGQLLVTVGDNPARIRSEAAFAMLCGVAPLPASSGHTHRHRLNRGGDRQANRALHTIATTRKRWDPRTKAYLATKTAAGHTRRDATRSLKRLIAREVYYLLRPDLTPQPVPPPGRTVGAQARSRWSPPRAERP